MSNSIVSQLFSFQGRVNRVHFARIFGLQVALYAIPEVALIKQLGGIQAIVDSKGAFLKSLPAGFGVAVMIFVIVMMWISCANHTKRLHDFGWSGWMQLAPVGIYLGSLLVGALGLGAGKGLLVAGGLVALLGMLGAGLFGLAILAMYFFRKGNEGSNRFGDPQGPSDGGARDWSAKAAVAFVKPAPEDGFARPAYRASGAEAGQLTSYHAPQARPSGFGRRGAAA